MPNRFNLWIACLCLCFLAPACLVRAADLAPVPELTGLVVDQAGALSVSERETLLLRLNEIQNSGQAQVGILVSGGIHGEPLAQYALRVAESWKLGRAKHDDGLLILVIPSSNSARIEVGYGLEGAIPDGRASQWLDELLPAIKNQQLSNGLLHLLDQIEGALPKPVVKTDANKDNYLFPDHPEWRIPFVLVVFSPFALFPLFMGRWGALLGGPMLAAFLGAAAWGVWNSPMVAYIVAGVALPLPFLWALNSYENALLAPWLRHGKTIGNLLAVAMFFSVITLFVGAGLSGLEPKAIAAAPVFAGLLATGLAVFLFPGKPAQYLMVFLRSAMHFVFIFIVAFIAFAPFIPQPTVIACAAACLVSGCAAIGLYLDSREHALAGSAPLAHLRWSHLFFGLALLAALPLGVMVLAMSAISDDADAQLLRAATGGGSVTGILWWGARSGLFAAARLGLGGLFGGGGAGRGD